MPLKYKFIRAKQAGEKEKKRNTRLEYGTEQATLQQMHGYQSEAICHSELVNRHQFPLILQ